ncbi:hypothetical protein GGI43DRAFT_389197 [Trichoderma evansii]
MLFKTTLLLPALLALSLATAVPAPEEDLTARGAFAEEDLTGRDFEIEDRAEEDLAARNGQPDCGHFAYYSNKFHRCICNKSGYTYYPNGKYCCQNGWTYYSDGRVCCQPSYEYDHHSHRCCQKKNYDFKHGRCH